MRTLHKDIAQAGRLHKQKIPFYICFIIRGKGKKGLRNSYILWPLTFQPRKKY